MQHVIELDSQAEQKLSQIVRDSGKSADEVLLAAVKDFLQQQVRRTELERFLEPYRIDLSGFTFDREMANER
ncbi:MAG: hypothetical protein ACU85E_08750 [Gammaproteobacteria bacterium]